MIGTSNAILYTISYMIEQLTGQVVHKDTDFLILDVNGVGYKIFVTPDTLAKLREEGVTLWTYLAVRENALDLYGFTLRKDLEFFGLLLGISGIGPKSALGVLSVADSETLRNAISSGDISYLTKVSGIGKKSAERIVIELKDKVGKVAESSILKEDTDALDALMVMGYSAAEVREALKKLPKTPLRQGSEGQAATKERIKEVLKLLSNNF